MLSRRNGFDPPERPENLSDAAQLVNGSVGPVVEPIDIFFKDDLSGSITSSYYLAVAVLDENWRRAPCRVLLRLRQCSRTQ